MESNKAKALKCADCGKLLRTAAEAQDHAEAFGHANFAETAEEIVAQVCTECGKPCESQTAMDLHKKRTGHQNFEQKSISTAIYSKSDASTMSSSAPATAASAATDVAMAESEATPEEPVDPEVLAAEPNDPDLVANLDQGALDTLVNSMGFSRKTAEKALYKTGTSNIEAVVTWIAEHENDADFHAPLKKSAHTGAAESTSSAGTSEQKLSKEEAAIRARELQERLRQRRLEKEKQEEREREVNRIKSGKQMSQTKQELEDLQRKRQLEELKREKIEAAKEKERLRKLLEEDRRERFGSKAVSSSSSTEAAPAAAPAVAKKSPAELMSLALRMIRTLYRPDVRPGVAKTALTTMRVYVKNVVDHPDEEKYRKIRVTNEAFQTRVGKVNGGIDFLKAVGFVEDGDFLALQAVDKGVLQKGVDLLEENIIALE
eukprot:GILK01001749.1.p1 GENE.GILK01001749.1~~GILK01001749.1.p1  ORF type:complete len:455 (+),score=102.40 GILK01001749.1:70-1365(+)